MSKAAGTITRTPIPPGHMAAWQTFLRTQSTVLHTLEQELQAARGLSLAWYDVLAQLRLARRPVRAGELSDLLLLSPSAGTRLVDRMVARGLVRRTQSSTDRRVVLIELTDLGVETLHEAAPVHVAGLERHFTRFLDSSQAEQLITLLEPIADAGNH